MRFVHLAPASQARRIARAGLGGAGASVVTGESQTTIVRNAVYAMPVVASFWTTYQWLRELRRGHDELEAVAAMEAVAGHPSPAVGRQVRRLADALRAEPDVQDAARRRPAVLAARSGGSRPRA